MSGATAALDDGRLLDVLRHVKTLSVQHHQLTGKPLGVTGEIAEFEAARLLGLTLAAARTPAFDAHRGEERIQIKGRVFKGTYAGQRMGYVKRASGCDALVLVLLDGATMDAREIWEASPSDVAVLQEQEATRGIPIARFVKTARCVWPGTMP